MAVKEPGRPRARRGRADDILEAFTRNVARSGYSGSNFSEIANELGISKGTIVHYYGTKDRLFARRNCQILWIGEFQATSVPAGWASVGAAGGVMSAGRSSSLPLWKTAPARTRATRCGALTARQRACAASISL